jgi:hypothetical protein
VPELRPYILGAGEPVLVMEIAEVPGTTFFLVEISKGDIQP